MRLSLLTAVGAMLVATALAGAAQGKEYPIGKPKTGSGMEVAAVYLQPIEMEPAGMMRAAAQSDIHLEADIHATKDNPNGFADGEWMPMVANDGPHYGDNVRLTGPGKYKLTLTIAPPSANPHVSFGRHVDKETGVGPWFKPFTVDFEFVFAGTGKKGAY
jgi:uncharacterized protein involved in high-affinity Fe2+ transport